MATPFFVVNRFAFFFSCFFFEPLLPGAAMATEWPDKQNPKNLNLIKP
jgi:hypothetical protein